MEQQINSASSDEGKGKGTGEETGCRRKELAQKIMTHQTSKCRTFIKQYFPRNIKIMYPGKEGPCPHSAWTGAFFCYFPIFSLFFRRNNIFPPSPAAEAGSGISPSRSSPQTS